MLHSVQEGQLHKIEVGKNRRTIEAAGTREQDAPEEQAWGLRPGLWALLRDEEGQTLARVKDEGTPTAAETGRRVE